MGAGFARRCALLPLLLTLACATPPRPPPQAPRRPPPAPRPASRERPEYTCRGAPGMPPWQPTFVTTAEGPVRLTVAPVGVRARGAPVPQARVRVVALQATVGALGVELARAVGVNVWVDPALVAARVTFAGEYTVERLAEHLRSASVMLEVGEYGFRLYAMSMEGQRRMNDLLRTMDSSHYQMLEPLETRLLPVPEGVDPVTVAGVYCRHIASTRGRASVVGRVLLIADMASHQNQAEQLLRGLDAMQPHAEAPTPVTPRPAPAR